MSGQRRPVRLHGDVRQMYDFTEQGNLVHIRRRDTGECIADVSTFAYHVIRQQMSAEMMQVLERKEAETQKLPDLAVEEKCAAAGAMLDYCAHAGCRHRALREYFGERLATIDRLAPCGACDLCAESRK